MRQYYYLLLGLLMLGCVFDEPNKPQEAGITYGITADQPTVARRGFDQCAMSYSFQNSARSLDINSILKQLEIPFDRWAQANGYLSFDRVSANNSAEISFVFADSLPNSQSKTYTFSGLIGQPIGALSQLVRQVNGSCVVYLLNTHAWNGAELQRVLLFQIGAAMGLATSSRSTSAMGNQLNTITQPDSMDVKSIQQLYNQPCDRWTRLADLPFSSGQIETSVATTSRGYALLKSNNALWEFNPTTKAWNSRLAYPTSQYHGIYGMNWLAFAIDSTFFIGESYTYTWQAGQKGAFWRYVPPENGERWVKIDSLPQLGWGAGYSFTIDKTGYVFTSNSVAGNSSISVCKYDPVLNKWTKPSIYNEPTLFAINDMIPFVLETNAYLVKPAGYYKSWRFTPTQSPILTEIPSFDGSSPAAAFSVRNAGYGVTGYNAKKYLAIQT